MAVFIFSVSCSEEDEYKKFLEGGEIYYPGKISSAFVQSGNERVRLLGLFLSDPKVTQCLVYWNIRQDSVVIPVVRQNIVDTLDYIIEDVSEGIHNFEFITMDENGNRSVVVNVTGQSYGEKFKNQLLNRPIKEHTYNSGTSTLVIDWASMDLSTGAYETEVQYNIGSNAQLLRVSIDSDQTEILDYDGTGYKYRTFFRPDEFCMDFFFTEFVIRSTN